MLIAHLLCCTALVLLVRGAPLDSSQETVIRPALMQHEFFVEDEGSSWPLPNTVMMRDTIDGFYETVVDDVLSTHSEDLLIALTHWSDKNQRLRKQVEKLGFHHVSDTCLAKMPGMIAVRTHELTARVFGAVTPAIDTTLPAVWPQYGAFEKSRINGGKPPRVPQHEIATALYSLNQAVAHSLIETMQGYDLLEHIKLDLSTCNDDATPHNNNNNNNNEHGLLSLLHRAKKAIWTGCASMEPTVATRQNNEPALLESYLMRLRTSLSSELEGRVGNLIVVLYNDLYDQDP